jgi:2',3'-cyclic-nucleotide 2'-phosphodiesterase (5'-nucleotidase family)
MYRKFLFLVFIAVGLTACRSHYEVTQVERSRILIDSRYDAVVDADARAFLMSYKNKVDSVANRPVGHAAKFMPRHRPESELSNLLADIMVWAGKFYGEKPDFGVYNMGGIRADLTKGDVTYGDILDVAPFENKICFTTLTGDKVMKLFQQIAKRGGEGVSKGVELVIKKGEPNELISARLHGQEIDPKAEYRIATINYLLEGNDGMPALREGTNTVAPQDASNNTRYLIMNYFRDMHAKGIVVDAQVEGRIKVQ